ncbi:MAG TPA: OmpH family outer membrane protein [Candidatus Acidoferrum sp.]|nr:OmpH family outer membrane protein [Candidatus Acidoferrum sp.]
MKTRIQLGLLALSVLVSCSSGFAADFKIATADYHKVFGDYYKTVQALNLISNKCTECDKELKVMNDSLKKIEDDWLQAEAKANDQAVPADQRAKYKTLANDIKVKLRFQGESITTISNRTQLQLEDQWGQNLKDLTTEIRAVMEATAKEQGYTLVLDRTGLTMAGTPLVLYTSGENDLTQALLKELNSTAPAASAPETNRSTNTPRLPAPGAKPPPATPPPG